MILAKRKAQVITWADSIKYADTDGDKISPIFVPLYLTVCVTCAGAGTAKPSDQKNDKACETA